MAANPQPAPEWKRVRGQYVSPEGLVAYQSDPKHDEKLGWIAVSASGVAFPGTVVCRRCGQILASISTVHLKSHDMTQKEYRAEYPGAPVYSPGTRAKVNKAALAYATRHREELRQYSEGWRKNPKNKPKLKAQGRRATARRRGNPEPHRVDDRTWYRKAKIPRASDAEFELFVKDPIKCNYVVCLEPDVLRAEQICRARLKDIACAHLAKIHRLTPEQYAEKHPGAPIKATRKRGRRPGRGAQLKERINLTAAFRKLGWSLNAMSSFVYKDTPGSAYSNMRNLASNYRAEIEKQRAAMTLSVAEGFVTAAGANPNTVVTNAPHFSLRP